MMPIFFNLESHLWVFYLFFVNGLLLHYSLASLSPAYRQLTSPVEAKVVAGLGLSMGLNGLVLLSLTYLNIAWESSLPLIVCLSVLLALALLLRIPGHHVEWVGDIGLARVALYITVWVLLFYNGGLIEQVSDAWWHMALADRMAEEGTLFTELGHLNGVSRREYPPLLHANLAMVSSLSGEPLPVLWNSVTAWMAAVKLMAYYLLALGLSRNAGLAIVAALIFVLVPGMGVSYLRVSAWPSHFAYVFMFASFYVAFRVLDRDRERSGYQSGIARGIMELFLLVRHNLVHVVSCLVLVSLIFFTHKLEVVWLAAGLGVYIVAASIAGVYRSAIEPHLDSFALIRNVLLLAIIASSIFLTIDEVARWRQNYDALIAYCLPASIALGALVLSMRPSKRLSRLVLCVLVVLLVGSIDLQHLRSLLFPLEALPGQANRELPLLAKGYFGGQLVVPGWHLQLRGALLYSGIVAIFVACALVWTRPNRLHLFLASNALVAVLFCLSPYLYQWLVSLMNYHSPWRILTLLFTPIILAAALTQAWNRVRE